MPPWDLCSCRIERISFWQRYKEILTSHASAAIFIKECQINQEMQEAMTTAVTNDFYIDSIDCLHVIRALTSFSRQILSEDKTGRNVNKDSFDRSLLCCLFKIFFWNFLTHKLHIRYKWRFCFGLTACIFSKIR